MITLAALAAATSLPVIDSIRIESAWSGLGEPSRATYWIVRRGDHYQRRSAPIPQAAIERLLAAVSSPPIDRNTGIQNLLTPEWLQAYSSESPSYLRVPRCSPEAKQLLKQYLADP